jgi:hypothetical protein
LQVDLAVTNEHDWPFERPAQGSLRPWFLSATGYLFALFADADAAAQAREGLLEQDISDADVRLYSSEQILTIEAQRDRESTNLAKAIAAVTVDRAAKKLYLDTARAGGAALWIFAPSAEAANRFARLLADYHYVLLRYYGDEGVVDIRVD